MSRLQWGRSWVRQRGGPGQEHGVLNSHEHLPPDWMAEMIHERRCTEKHTGALCTGTAARRSKR